MLDHLSLSVNDFEQSIKFYDETLHLLGIERVMTFDSEDGKAAGYGSAGYASAGKPSFWISLDTILNQQESVGKARGFHVAFRAPSVESIQQWYTKCLELGGRDNGVPGPRPEYHPGYYAAFIIDPNGWRIEAVLHNYKG